MISFRRELLCEVVEEVQPLLERHYLELTRNKDVVKLAPKWAAYAAMEQPGCFTVFTARDDDKLIGYNAFFVQTHMHYEGLTVAQNDVFWIEPDYRRGVTALRFLRFCEDHLKAQGVMKLVYHCKPSNNFAPILHLLGYADEEVMCGKIL